jgi:hypothetical protein
MKLTLRCLLCVILLAQGVPFTVHSQEAPDVYALPDGKAGERYVANIATVLGQNYALRVETGRRTSVFRWTLDAGELPPGIFVRPNGTISGMPRSPREEPYIFSLKVADAATLHSTALVLNFSLKVSQTALKLTRVDGPKLVPASREAHGLDTSVRRRQQAVSAGRNMFTPVAINISERGFTNADTGAPKASSAPPHEQSGSGSGDGTSISNRVTPSFGEAARDTVPTGAAAQAVVCTPLPTPSGKLFVIDASSVGETSGERKFEKGDVVKVVIKNKNPYLYRYTYTEDRKVVEETAIGKFIPLLGGVITDFTAEPKPAAADAGKAVNPVNPAGGGNPMCQSMTLTTLLTALNDDKNRALTLSETIAQSIKRMGQDNKKRKDAYDLHRKVLLDDRSTGDELYCESKKLLAVTDAGATASDIEATQKETERLRSLVRSFTVRADIIERDFPNCADKSALETIRVAADGLLVRADKYDKAVKDLTADQKKMDDFKEVVDKVARNQRNFIEVHELGRFDRTTTVGIGLQRTQLAPAEGTTAKAEDLVKATDTVLKFGHAPFFSISGGLAFSPLRKREYVRVQGFERDIQGNPVLSEGKPNLTTVIGLKEDSPTRITPLVMLNGRLPGSKMGPIDGWHLSLGVTAKNDNKGTDLEFLVGPSISLLEDNLFFTFGGYAGRQQRLAGDLFEGAAVPAGVDELPIQKNYRWNTGFSITYKIPIGNK